MMRTVTTLLLTGAVAGFLFGTNRGRRLLALAWDAVASSWATTNEDVQRKRREQQIDRQLQRLHEYTAMARAMAQAAAR